jgi:hypothetical protein
VSKDVVKIFISYTNDWLAVGMFFATEFDENIL